MRGGRELALRGRVGGRRRGQLRAGGLSVMPCTVSPECHPERAGTRMCCYRGPTNQSALHGSR